MAITRELDGNHQESWGSNLHIVGWQSPESWGGTNHGSYGGNHQIVRVAITRELVWQSPDSWGGNHQSWDGNLNHKSVGVAISRELGGNHQRVGVAITMGVRVEITRELGWQSSEI